MTEELDLEAQSAEPEREKVAAGKFGERTGYIVWYSDWKAARGLDKYGALHYMSRKMSYAVLYVNAESAEDTLRLLQKLPYVKKVERSYRNEIKTEYERNVPDKTRFYGL
ncbi:YlbG family protein [Cohnella zeiphila]|uniref:YlbG family protein n=1 Tax=Cohnella zeiphila TaxID=2761120 RepID=A0A7X0VYY9_9BACL|nr:YlbG family protein [Cohnella zeiphila]MBB6735879.1 YlbG family protein [Cohnella zeiphila]